MEQEVVKLVVLKLDGDVEKTGVRVTLEIGLEGKRPEVEMSGKLPVAPQLRAQLNQWQQKYREVGSPARIKPGKIKFDGSINDRIQECRESAKKLGSSLTEWLDSEEFRPLDKRLREEVNRDENVRVLIRTENWELQKLPWHLWDFFERYPNAEMALSPYQYKRLQAQARDRLKPKVKILAILGHSEGIDTKADRQLLEKLPNADIQFLIEPQHQEINDQLWEQAWDIIFFAGHSETEGETGRIYINPQESLTIDELWYGLRKAVARGLKLAIFNSCDGLGLARKLNDLQIPQMIVMRELVPDRVAQEFLKYFLASFSGGEPFYLAVREARERLQGLESQFPCATWLPVICQHPIETPPAWEEFFEASLTNDNVSQGGDRPRRLSIPWWRGWQKVVLTSVAVTGLVMGVRSLGWLQTWELKSYDHLMRSRPQEEIDNRILLVAITAKDVQAQPAIERLNRSLSDRSLAQLLNKLEQHKPSVIGLLLYRDTPVNPEYKKLAIQMQKSDRIFAICTNDMPPVPEILAERSGFNNVVRDNDLILRRHLLAMNKNSDCKTEYSFSLQLAKRYLIDKGIKLTLDSEDNLQFGKSSFKRMEKDSGSYQNIDARGHQVMLNYRATTIVAPQVTLTEVLNDQINPETVKNRIVIIGTIASTFKNDEWLTPYSEGEKTIQRMTGLELQAHMVSQTISTVLDNRPLIWWWSNEKDTLWIWCWSLIGGILSYRFWHLQALLLVNSIVLCILYGICLTSLIIGGWIPFIPAALAVVVTSAAISIYRVTPK